MLLNLAAHSFDPPNRIPSDITGSDDGGRAAAHRKSRQANHRNRCCHCFCPVGVGLSIRVTRIARERSHRETNQAVTGDDVLVGLAIHGHVWLVGVGWIYGQCKWTEGSAVGIPCLAPALVGGERDALGVDVDV